MRATFRIIFGLIVGGLTIVGGFQTYWFIENVSKPQKITNWFVLVNRDPDFVQYDEVYINEKLYISMSKNIDPKTGHGPFYTSTGDRPTKYRLFFSDHLLTDRDGQSFFFRVHFSSKVTGETSRISWRMPISTEYPSSCMSVVDIKQGPSGQVRTCLSSYRTEENFEMHRRVKEREAESRKR